MATTAAHQGGEGAANRAPQYYQKDVNRKAVVVRVFWMTILAVGVGLTSANKGYDKEENPTNLFKGYCVPLDFNTELGLCQGYRGSVRVCAAGTAGTNRLAAQTWYSLEVNNRNAYINSKSLVFGDQAFQKLQLVLNSWVCKQMGENVRQRVDLTPAQKQEAACNFVWRRDEEIQKQGSPTPGAPWGVITYDPPGENTSSWVFKGLPKNQCDMDYDCRTANDPGKVQTCCDYCERYFNTFCDVTPEEVFKFCMERVHCVCNSVTKPCYRKYPLYGAACSPASTNTASLLITVIFSLVLGILASLRR